MRILGACIFSKFFGGKTHHIWTDVTCRINKENWRVYFFQVFWREMKNFEQPSSTS